MEHDTGVGEWRGRPRAAGRQWATQGEPPTASALVTTIAQSLAAAEDALREERFTLLQAAVELKRLLHPLHVGSEALLRCGELAPAARALVAQQLRAVHEASRLLEALSHVEELETRTRRPVDVPFELDDLVTGTIREQAEVARARGAGVDVAAPPAWVQGDQVLLHDVFGLLLAELLRASTGSTLDVDVREGPEYCVVSLRRSERFALRSAEAGPTTRGADAIGLRLALALATRLGCTVEYSLQAGGLIAADVRLPRAMGTVARVERRAAADRPRGTGLQVLIVDDDAAVRLATRLLLEAEGLHVRVASCRDEALASIGAELPDVVVADVHLGPGESGPDVIAAVRARCAADVPAVLVTGDVARAPATPGCRVLSKPFAADALLDAIADASEDAGRSAAASGDVSAVRPVLGSVAARNGPAAWRTHAPGVLRPSAR